MILVFGGTTEGRKAVKELEEAGRPYYYSTKGGEQDIALHHGIRCSGAMNREQMAAFCRGHGIRLLIDAAHPFAEQLHQTVADTAADLGIPAIRFERIYPERDTERITWCSDYADAVSRLTGTATLLATTGVQSIRRLAPLKNRGTKVYYRILERESSLSLAHAQGATDDELCFYHQEDDNRDVLGRLRPDAILLKESGNTGGFNEKVKAAAELGVRIYAIRRPQLPATFHQVDGEHGMRRMVERLLPGFYSLNSGLTTGTYATAAAVAAAIRLRRNETPAEVPVVLPNGETIRVPVRYGDGYAYAIKESGDDPDVTNGIEIRAAVEPAGHFEICGGEGIGTFTLPGFDYPPGEAAVNRAPRQMLKENVGGSLRITLSVPGGEEIARRTFNPRLGIAGGISIIGVSGIVKPFSEEAFIDSIRKCMEVAKACGSRRVVINSGAKSERYVRAFYPQLPPQAFVEYGNYIGEAIKIAARLDIKEVTLGVMLGKAVKLAAGHLDTHSRKVVMDKSFIARLLRESGCGEATVRRAGGITLARELWGILPRELIPSFCSTVIAYCQKHCRPLLPQGQLTVLLIDDEGTVFPQEE